jgi:hypothetical protein
VTINVVEFGASNGYKSTKMDWLIVGESHRDGRSEREKKVAQVENFVGYSVTTRRAIIKTRRQGY